MEQLIEDLFPIMAIEHDCILSRRGDISIVFKAKLPEIFTQSDANYEVFISLGGALSEVYRTEVSDFVSTLCCFSVASLGFI